MKKKKPCAFWMISSSIFVCGSTTCSNVILFTLKALMSFFNTFHCSPFTNTNLVPSALNKEKMLLWGDCCFFYGETVLGIHLAGLKIKLFEGSQTLIIECQRKLEKHAIFQSTPGHLFIDDRFNIAITF